MAAYSFAPFSGPHGSTSGANVYVLPNTKADSYEVSPVLDELDSTRVRLTGGNGSIMHGGTGPAYLSGGTIKGTWNLSGAFLKTFGYATTVAGCNLALNDLSQWVYMGGLGILVDRWWTGTAWDTKTCTCRLHTPPVRKPIASGYLATVDYEFFCPMGYWTLSDGVTLEFMT